MSINTTLAGLSQNVANNGPDGAVDPPSMLDDAIRYHGAFIAKIRDDYPVADALIRSDLAAPGGAAIVGLQPDGTGADATDLQTAVRRHFIDGDSWVKPSYSAATNVTRWALMVTYINTLGTGAEVRFSRGTILFNAAITLPVKTTLWGEGRQSTVFSFSHTGDGFQSIHAINSSTAVWIKTQDLGIVCSNAASTGAGFVDVGGTYVDLENTYINGFKYQVIFDQTEIATIKTCELIQAATGQVGVWLVNGADHTALAAIGYTNRITISETQFNGGTLGSYNIIDDGGINHSIRDNNFNGGARCIRAADVVGLAFTGNESETHTLQPVHLTNTTLAGAYVGPCTGLDISGGNTFSDGTANHILIDDAQGGGITGNAFCQYTSSAILFNNSGTALSSGLVIEGNSKLITGVTKTDGPFVDAVSLDPFRMNQIRQQGMTYVTPPVAGAGTATITPHNMEGIYLGSRLACQNADGSNKETVLVTALTASTFTASFASVKATNWTIVSGSAGRMQEAGSWTPVLVGATTAGANTYSLQSGQWSRIGNAISVRGSLSVSAKDAAIAGELRITGLPFAPSPVANANSLALIGLFSGFRLGAGYTQLAGSITPSSSYIGLRKSGSDVGLALVTSTDIPGATVDMYFSAEYFTLAL